ncbi:MAG: hypothetical protein RSA91_00340 [Bacilli bacterium]
MANTRKALFEGSDIVIALLIIGVIVFLVGIGTGMLKEAGPKMTDMQARVSDSQYSEFDNRGNIGGTQAINAIRQYASNNFTVTIKTNANSAGKSYNSPGAYIVTDISDPNYIEPTASFRGQLLKSSNKTVNGIILIQE